MKTTNTTCTANDNNQATFTQAFDHVMCDKSQSLLGRLLYCRLARFIDNGKDAFPSNVWLAEEFGSNERQIRTELSRLVDAGLISKKQRGLNKTNIYTVNPWPMDAFNAKNSNREERKEDFTEEEETQQEPPLEAPETLSNEVNTHKMDECIPEEVKALTDAPTKPERILGLPDEEPSMTSPSPTTPSEAKFANVPDKFKPARRIDFSVKEEEYVYGL